MPDSPSENKPADNKENMERHFFRASAEDFKKIPGSPIAYWASKKLIAAFLENTTIENNFKTSQGMKTLNNDKFIREWYEVSLLNTSLCDYSIPKWYPINHGGDYRKWFGNNESLINWENDGKDIKVLAKKKYNSVTRTVTGMGHYFKEGITWTAISSSRFSVRRFPNGYLFTNAGMCAFSNSIKLDTVCCFLNSRVAIALLEFLSPTLNFGPNQIKLIPLSLNEKVLDFVKKKFSTILKLAKVDWDSFENSWNFTSLPILKHQFQTENCHDQIKTGHYPLTTNHSAPLSTHYTHLRSQWQQTTLEMQRLEEENNRIFIEAYGLQDELTPEVPLKEITLTCNPHYRYGGDKTEEELEALLLADTMKEYISYAVGCMLGRYSIDKPGLILANQGETIDDYVRKVISGQGLVISEEKGEVGSDQWLVDSEKEEEEKSSDCEEFQGSDCLAEGNGSRGRGLSDNETIPKGRNLQFDQSASQSSCINSVEYSRGTGSSINCGVQELSVDSSRFFGGSGNSITDSSTAELPDTGATFRNHDNTSGSKQNASGTHEQTNHSPLTTNHLSFLPDEDNVIPILDAGWFSDDITERFKKFLKVTFGEENYETNLKFIEDAIGKDIRKYFLKDFYSDHVKRYKKRPIYWLFSSPKGSFNALIYMHRYQPDTASIVLNEYLREFRAKLSARKEHQEAISISSSASQKEKTQALKDIEKLKKTIEELDEYEREILYPLATRQISIDLDDGVKVNYLKFGAALKKIPGLDTVED